MYGGLTAAARAAHLGSGRRRRGLPSRCSDSQAQARAPAPAIAPARPGAATASAGRSCGEQANDRGRHRAWGRGFWSWEWGRRGGEREERECARALPLDSTSWIWCETNGWELGREVTRDVVFPLPRLHGPPGRSATRLVQICCCVLRCCRNAVKKSDRILL